MAEVSFFQFPEGNLSLPEHRLISVEAYERLLAHASKQEDFVYLGSIGGGESRGAYTAFSALAAETITEHFDEKRLSEPQAISNAIERRANAYARPGQQPFPVGGWVGFISYEFGYDCEPRLTPLRRRLPLPLFNGGLYLWMAGLNRDSGQYYLWVHPLCDEATRIRLQQWETLPAAENNAGWSLTRPFQARQTPDDFRASVARIRAYITAGDCYQVNLSQEFTAGFSGDAWQAFRALSEANPTPHSAFIRQGKTSVISVSPERFLQIRGRQVTTSPIKGTRRRGSNPREDKRLAKELMHSEKDRAENLMIVDLLRNDLSRNAASGSVRVDGLFNLESYRNVHHLVSHIRCELADGVSPMKALLDAFPGGSITGAPKIRAMEIIRELEPHYRGPYCGSVFFRGLDDSLESNIAIRTLFCDGEGEIHCCGGGGIVADSDPDSEYRETLTKVKPLMDFLERSGSQ